MTADLLAPRPKDLVHEPNPIDGCACLQLIETASYELHVRPAGEGVLEGTLGSRSLEFSRIDQTWVCRFSTENFVGPTSLRLGLGGERLLDLPLEVRSRKLKYLTHYRALVNELTDWAASLCFRDLSPTAFRTLVDDPSPPTSFLSYLVLRHLLRPDRLPGAVRRISRQPDRRLVRDCAWRDFSEARNQTSRSLLALLAHPEHLARAEGRGAPAVRRALGDKLPTRLLDEEVRSDLDTPPNRFVAHALREADQTLRRLEQDFRGDLAAHPARADFARHLADDCGRLQQRVSELRRLPFLQTVGRLGGMPAASPVLMRREGYREVLDAFYRMRTGGRVRWEALETLLTVPARDLPTLYELWCFFALADALARRSGARPDWARLIRPERGLYSVRLGHGRRTSIAIGPYRLSYNRSFRRSRDGTWSIPLRPDYVVERDGRRWIFDAKYRLDSSGVDQGFKDQPRHRGSFVRGDLYKMHTYLSAIRRAEAAFVLYPGDVFRAFDQSCFLAERATDLPARFRGVGAIPLLPGQTAWLDETIQAIL